MVAQKQITKLKELTKKLRYPPRGKPSLNEIKKIINNIKELKNG